MGAHRGGRTERADLAGRRSLRVVAVGMVGRTRVRSMAVVSTLALALWRTISVSRSDLED